MIEVANQIKIENSGHIEQVNVFALENMLYISIPENSYWSGYCVIYQMTGQIENGQDLLRGRKFDKSFICKRPIFSHIEPGT